MRPFDIEWQQRRLADSPPTTDPQPDPSSESTAVETGPRPQAADLRTTLAVGQAVLGTLGALEERPEPSPEAKKRQERQKKYLDTTATQRSEDRVASITQAIDELPEEERGDLNRMRRALNPSTAGMLIEEGSIVVPTNKLGNPRPTGVPRRSGGWLARRRQQRSIDTRARAQIASDVHEGRNVDPYQEPATHARTRKLKRHNDRMLRVTGVAGSGSEVKGGTGRERQLVDQFGKEILDPNYPELIKADTNLSKKAKKARLKAHKEIKRIHQRKEKSLDTVKTAMSG